MTMRQSFGSTPLMDRWEAPILGLTVEVPSLTTPKLICSFCTPPPPKIGCGTEIPAHSRICSACCGPLFRPWATTTPGSMEIIVAAKTSEDLSMPDWTLFSPGWFRQHSTITRSPVALSCFPAPTGYQTAESSNRATMPFAFGLRRDPMLTVLKAIHTAI